MRCLFSPNHHLNPMAVHGDGLSVGVCLMCYWLGNDVCRGKRGGNGRADSFFYARAPKIIAFLARGGIRN